MMIRHMADKNKKKSIVLNIKHTEFDPRPYQTAVKRGLQQDYSDEIQYIFLKDASVAIFEKSMSWYDSDEVLHRANGPANILHKCPDSLPIIEWWWHGRRYEYFSEWAEVAKVSNEIYMFLKLKYGEKI